MIDKAFFISQLKMITYDNIREIGTGHRDHYTTACLLDYPYFQKNYKLIAIDLSKEQALDADPKTIQQVNFTENLEWDGNTTSGNKRNQIRFFR